MEIRKEKTNKLTTDKLNILYIKNSKVILIDTDKIYNVKVGKMLKTYDNKFISRKVIKNENNKLYYRHIYSLLPDEIITEIQQRIYKYIFQRKVLKIDYDRIINKHLKLDDKNFLLHLKMKNERSYSNSKNLKKKLNEPYLFDFKNVCCGLLNNGSICGCSKYDNIFFKNNSNYYNNNVNSDYECYLFNDNYIKQKVDRNYKKCREEPLINIAFCQKHYNKVIDMSEYKKNEYIELLYYKLGYEVKNGYLLDIKNRHFLDCFKRRINN